MNCLLLILSTTHLGTFSGNEANSTLHPIPNHQTSINTITPPTAMSTGDYFAIPIMNPPHPSQIPNISKTIQNTNLENTLWWWSEAGRPDGARGDEASGTTTGLGWSQTKGGRGRRRWRGAGTGDLVRSDFGLLGGGTNMWLLDVAAYVGDDVGGAYVIRWIFCDDRIKLTKSC